MKRRNMNISDAMAAVEKIEESFGVFDHPVQDHVNRLCQQIYEMVGVLDDALVSIDRTGKDMDGLVEHLRKEMNRSLTEDQRTAVKGFREEAMQMSAALLVLKALKKQVQETRDKLPGLHERVQRLF